MADNFNLRQFLSENKLTKNAKLLKEEVSLNGKPINTRSIEIDGIDRNDYPDFVDAYITYAEYEDGTPLSDEELVSLEDENYGLTGELIHDRQLYLQEREGRSNEEKVMEATLSSREKYLTRLVENALGIDEEEHPFGTNKLTGEPLPDPASQAVTEDEMVKEKALPKYENIEKLMQEIEHGTNEAAYKHKMAKMKEVAEMLEARVSSLEEGDGAEFVDTKKVKQMKKDIMTLRKQAEKLEKDYDKKFGEKKSKKQTQTESKMENFNLKKFLTENKLTTNSRMLNEEGFTTSSHGLTDFDEATYPVLEAFKKAGIDMNKMVSVIEDGGEPIERNPQKLAQELERTRKSILEDYEEGDDFPVFYEYENNTVLPEDMPEGKEFKVCFHIFESNDYSILQ